MEEEKKRKEKRKSVCGKPKGKKKKTVHVREKGKWRKGKRRFSQCSDGRTSIVRELKLVHATRAMGGYQNLSFSSKLQEVGVFSYISSSLFKSRKWSCGSAQTWD